MILGVCIDITCSEYTAWITTKYCSCFRCSLLAYNIIVDLSTPKRNTLYYNHKDDSSVYTACRFSPLSQDELTSASCQWKRYYNSQKIVFDYLLWIVSLSPSWIKLRTFDISLLLPAKDIVKCQMSTGVYVQLVLTRMPGERYRGWFGYFLLCSFMWHLLSVN